MTEQIVEIVYEAIRRGNPSLKQFREHTPAERESMVQAVRHAMNKAGLLPQGVGFAHPDSVPPPDRGADGK